MYKSVLNISKYPEKFQNLRDQKYSIKCFLGNFQLPKKTILRLLFQKITSEIFKSNFVVSKILKWCNYFPPNLIFVLHMLPLLSVTYFDLMLASHKIWKISLMHSNQYAVSFSFHAMTQPQVFASDEDFDILFLNLLLNLFYDKFLLKWIKS